MSAMMNSQTDLRTPQKRGTGESPAKEPEDQGSRHPGAYTLGHSWFLNQEWKWARWAKGHAFRESLAHKGGSHEGVIPTSLPKNWKGPVLANGMDKLMSQVWAKLQTCEILEQSLRRCHARSQRGFIMAILHSLDIGLADEDYGLGFHPDERSEDGHRGLKLIRREELRWLKMIAEETPIFYYENQSDEHLGKRAKVFLERVLTLVEDLSPTALFRDNQLKSIDDFRRELNDLRKKEVQGIAFSVQEIILFTEKLEKMGILRLEWHGDDGFVAISEPPLHLERAIRWSEKAVEARAAVAYETHEFDTDAEEVDAEEVVEEKPEEPEEAQDPGLDEEQHLPYGIDMPIEGDDSNSDEELNESKRPQLELRDRGGECLSSHLSNSTILNISLLDDDEQFNEITLNTPHDDDMLSVDELKGERMPRQAQISTTWTFFFRITYRFGQSLRQLREEMQAISLRLGDQDVKRANGHFLKRSIEFWLDDAAERPNRPEKNPASFPKHKLGDPLHRVTPKYRDIVQAIDPELVKEHDLSEIQCADIVRKAIITEAYYNRSVPSPVRLPSFKPDSQGTQEGDRLRMDRSCIWSFGDPRIKGRAGKRWLDVNRWPPQAQSAETWREICRRGDERSPLNLLDTEADSTDEEDDFEAKELRHYVGGRTLEGDGQGGPSRAHYNNMLLKPLKRHGESHYWQGDTELQKAVVNDRMRLRFETTLPPPSPPPTLRARLSWLWGGSKKRKREDEPPPVSVFKRQRVYETPPELALPRVPEGKIPRSKAPKVEEAGEKAPLPNPKVLDTEALEARAVQTRMAEARNGAEDGALDAVDKATGA